MGDDSINLENALPVSIPLDILFNASAKPRQPAEDMRQELEQLDHDLLIDDTGLDSDYLVDMLRQTEAIEAAAAALKITVKRKMFPRYLQKFEQETALLADPEAPVIGRQFIERLHDINCTMAMDTGMKALEAVYVSYSYKARSRGFMNTVNINPDKITGDFNCFASSLRHEVLHGLQKHAAPALHFSPFNPDTRILVHPMDWIKLEQLCEEDAYTKQAFFNAIEAIDKPSIRHTSRLHVVSVADFERHRNETQSLQDALKSTALSSLEKPVIENNYNRLFRDNYHDIALRNYSSAMVMRMEEKETGHVYIRLEPQDFHAVGAYDVGPNVLGEKTIDPRFLKEPQLNTEHAKKYHALCKAYDIPDLETCPTLSEIMNQKHLVMVRQQMAASMEETNAPVCPQMA